jgi:hypothetical protein
MNERSLGLLLLAGGACCAVLCQPAPDARPRPVKPPLVRPSPPAPPAPRRPLLPRRPREVGAYVGGPTGRDGTELHCDLPAELHQRNTGGSDGAGLCVYASARHAGLWQDDPVWEGMFQWMRGFPGGSYPEKFKRSCQQYASAKGLPQPQFLCVQSRDLDILKAACKSGRMPGVTYNYSPSGRYGGRRIAHMVSLVHADDKNFVILDNNYPGGANYEWLTPDEFARVYGGWAIVLLNNGPPPVPQ